jgi:hypothetical protein
MATRHGFCTLHKIAFDRTLDPICPQCSLARIEPFKDLDYDVTLKTPLDAAGKPLELAAVRPEKF